MAKNINIQTDPRKGKIVGDPNEFPHEDSDELKPVFCFQHLVKKYAIKDLEKNDKVSLINKLESLSELNWRDIKKNGGKHSNGCEPLKVAELKKSAVPTAFKHNPIMIRFRYKDKKAMIGFRTKEIFHVVWIDPKFEIYDHGS